MKTKNTETQETQEPANKGQKQNKTIWIIGIVLGLIALFVLIVALIPTEEKRTFWEGIKHGFHLLLIMKVLGIKAWALLILAEIVLLITAIVRFAKADGAGAKIFDFLWRQHGHWMNWITHHLGHAIVAIVKSDVWKKIGKGELEKREVFTIAGIIFVILLFLNFGTLGITIIQIGGWKFNWDGLYSHNLSDKFPLYWTVILLALFTLYILRSLRTFKRDIVGGRFIFGSYTGDIKEGLDIIPYGAGEAITVSHHVKKDIFPAPLEKLHLGEGAVPEGFVSPFRITTGEEENSEHPLDKSLTVIPLVVVRHQTKWFEPFFRNAGTEENTKDQIFGELPKILGEIFRKNTVKWILDHPEKVNEMIKERAEMACREIIPDDALGYNDILKKYNMYDFILKYVKKGEDKAPKTNGQEDYTYLAHTVDLSTIDSEKEEVEELKEKVEKKSGEDSGEKNLKKELKEKTKEVEMKEELNELLQTHSLGEDIVSAALLDVIIPKDVDESLSGRAAAILDKEKQKREDEAKTYAEELLAKVDALRIKELSKVLKNDEAKFAYLLRELKEALKDNTKYGFFEVKELIGAMKGLVKGKINL